VAEIRETGTGHQTDVSGAENGDAARHVRSPYKFILTEADTLPSSR
jgi:hypothetical protein